MKKTSALFVLFLLSCVPQPKVSGTPDTCAKAQVKLSELGCREAKSPRGRSYESICINKLEDGIDLKSVCVSQITSCDEVEKCNKSR